MSTDERDLSGQAIDEALKAALGNIQEQLEALDEAIAYHVDRANELRETRKRVDRVAKIVDPQAAEAAAKKPGQLSDKGREALATRTRRRHAEERALKKGALVAHVQSIGSGVDVTATELFEGGNVPSPEGRPDLVIGRALMAELLDEIRRDGQLRLDRMGNGGKKIYRVVNIA